MQLVATCSAKTGALLLSLFRQNNDYIGIAMKKANAVANLPQNFYYKSVRVQLLREGW